MKYWAVMVLGAKENPENPDSISIHLTATGSESKEFAIKKTIATLKESKVSGLSYVFEVKEISRESYGFIVAANANDNLSFQFEEDNIGNA